MYTIYSLPEIKKEEEKQKHTSFHHFLTQLGHAVSHAADPMGQRRVEGARHPQVRPVSLCLTLHALGPHPAWDSDADEKHCRGQGPASSCTCPTRARGAPPGAPGVCSSPVSHEQQSFSERGVCVFRGRRSPNGTLCSQQAVDLEEGDTLAGATPRARESLLPHPDRVTWANHLTSLCLSFPPLKNGDGSPPPGDGCGLKLN